MIISKAFADRAGYHIQRLENSRVILPALGVLGVMAMVLGWLAS